MAARNYPLAEDAIFHSDRGAQYTSQSFAEATAALDVRRRSAASGSCFDNRWPSPSTRRSKSSECTVPSTRHADSPQGRDPVHRVPLQYQASPLGARLPNPTRGSRRVPQSADRGVIRTHTAIRNSRGRPDRPRLPATYLRTHGAPATSTAATASATTNSGASSGAARAPPHPRRAALDPRPRADGAPSTSSRTSCRPTRPRPSEPGPRGTRSNCASPRPTPPGPTPSKPSSGRCAPSSSAPRTAPPHCADPPPAALPPLAQRQLATPTSWPRNAVNGPASAENASRPGADLPRRITRRTHVVTAAASPPWPQSIAGLSAP